MSRRAALLTQADISRAIRAAKQAGADCIKVAPDGTITVLLRAPPLIPSPEHDDDPVIL